MELNQVLGALRNADAAGDVESAKRLALIAKTMTGQAAPEAIMSTEDLQNAKSAPTSISDIARSFGSGVVGAGKSLVDVFGAGSGASEYLGEVAQGLQQGLTPERKAEMARRAELSKRAEKEGTFAEIKSGLAGILEAPLQSIAQGVGSSLPTIAAGLVALPASAPAALAVGVQRASQILISAAQGTGEVKGDVFESIKQAYKEKGMDDAQASKLATEAQAYTLKNAPLLIGGAAFGALDAATGFEKSASKALRGALTPEKTFTKEGLDAAIANLPKKAVEAPTYLGQAVKTGIGESIPEGLQGGYGQLAQNVAMTQAGFETPTFQGVAGAAARDALVGALTGTAMSPLSHSVANAEFQADKYLRGVQSQQQFEKEREEFAKTQEQTKENLGVNKALMLGYEPPAEEEKYTNPAATLKRGDFPTGKSGDLLNQEFKLVDDFRKQNNLPKLKAYSIEDIKDAMPGRDPEGEQGRIDAILTAMHRYEPVDVNTGKPVNYTADDVITAAEDEKNIATGTKGFKDFLTRTTGSSDLNTMTQPQLFAAYSEIKKLPESKEKVILPEGTGASRFTDKQYKKAVSWFNQTFEGVDNKPLSRETIIGDIQEATGLGQKQDAEALLNTAVRNGDLAETEERVYRTYDANDKLVSTYRDKEKAAAAAKKQGLNVREETLRQMMPPPAAEPAKRANLPQGYAMSKETIKEGEVPVGFDIFPEGKGKALITVPTSEAVQAKIDELIPARKKEAARYLGYMDRDKATLQKARDGLVSMEARGEVGSQAYELAKTKLAKQERVLGNRILKSMERITEYEQPLISRPSEKKKQITREKITVTKQGKFLGSFPDNVKAQEAILVQMSDQELADTASDGRLGAIADRAAKEIERRKSPAGIMVRRTPKAKEELPPLSPELTAVADEIAKKLVPILQRMGLGDVGFKIVQSIKNGGEGSYTKNLIQLAIDAEKPLEVMHHESLHALKDLGFFTPQQWSTLENQAQKSWITKYLKNVQVEVEIEGKKQTMSRFDAYVALGYTPDDIVEEAIADAFADFATTKPPGGMIASIMKRLNDLFKAIKNAFNRSGFESAEDIFAKAQRGELRGTTAGTEAEKLSLRVPLSTRSIMEQNDAFAQGELGLTNNPVFLTYDPKTGQVVSAHKKLETAQARAKKEDLKVKKGFENNVRDVAIALNNETKEQYGSMDQKTLGSADSDALAKAMADEVGYQLRAMSKTGTGQGWYSNNYPNAVKRLSKRFPELEKNKHARSVFSALVAVTSNGEDVSTNIGNAIYYYSKLRMGKPLVALGSRRANALENNLQQLEDLLKTHGKDFEKVLLEEITVKDMNAYLRSVGEKTSSDYLANTVIPKAAIYFGPKLGAFYANLSGSEGYLTMDLWWSRTMNRMRGLLLPEATESSIESFKEMIGEPNASKERIVNLTIPLRNKYEEFGWNTELEHLVGAKEPSTNADKPKWDRKAKKLAGDAYEQLVFDHRLEKMANTIYKNEFETLEEAPFSASDRKFMYDAARKTQSLLRKEGVNLSLADIQAALWYYEKRLYAKLKGGKPDDIGYEEAIIENANKASGRERPSVVFTEQPNGGDVSQTEVADSDAIGGSSASGEEKYSLRGIIAEVAPHPDQEVVSRWREMTPSERLAATTNVANKTMRRIFDELGFTGYTYKFSTGKYEGEQNPNILVEAPNDASIQDLNKLARVMGFVFDQKAMIAYDETNTTSDDQGSFVKVIIPDDMSPTDLNRLRDLIGTNVPQAEGDTLRDGALIFGNFSAFNDNIETLNDKQFRRALADAVESFDYDGVIQVSEPETFHSQYIWPDNRDGYLEGTEYGNGRDVQGEEGRDVRGGGRSRLETIAQEAISLRDRWIDARGAARIGSGTKFNKVAVPEPTAEYGEPTEGSVSAVGVHFSKQPRPVLVSSMYGTGLKGAESERLRDAPDIRPRIYFYVDKGNGIRPEAGVGGSPHVIRLNNLYDATADSKGIIKRNTGATMNDLLNNLERSIVEAGYDGYLSKDPLLDQGFAVLVGKHSIETNEKLSLRSTRQPPSSKEFKNWFTGSYFTSGGEPLIMYHGTARDITQFKGKQAGAIFITTKPDVAETYAGMGVDYMRVEAYKALTREEKVDLITTVAEQAERDGTITAKERKEIISELKKRVPAVDPEKKRILGLPYQIEGEIIESLNNLLPTKNNIMPVYVNAKNVFDYANKDDVNRVYEWMMNNSTALGPMANPEDWLKSVKGQISRGLWTRIESEPVQEAIRALGFDGFSVLEAGTKNYAVYNPTAIKSVTGNIGTFGLGEISTEQAAQFGMTPEQARQAQAEGDIRFSLKKVGYHSGDLGYGTDTVLGRMAGSRSTGHFGTGVYFVGKPISREGRPTKIADLSQYNLFKPSFPSSAEGVHNALKLVNRAVGRDLSDEDQKSQYDNDIDEAAMYLDILLRTSFTRPEIKKVIESSVAEARKERTPEIIHTDAYIDSASTRVMKKLGFDGVDVRGLEGFDNTEYGTVVYRETVPEYKEKLSLRAATPAAINDAIDKTTSVREQKGFVERMMEAISPQSWSDFRAKALNRYNAMSVADKKRAQKMGGTALLADQSAESAALMSDLSAGVTASVLGVHDRNGGAPVFRNGITTIDGSIKGPVAIFAPLARYGDPRVYQMWQFYAGAKRARRYFKDGKEQNYTPTDMAYADQLGQQYPEFKQIFEEWNKFNNALVQYQVDTGVLSKERADEYRKYSDYLPFYRQLEDEATLGPKVFQSISGVKGPKKLKGSEAPIADLMETIVRNVQSGIQAGMKNTAAQRAIKVFEDIGEAVPTHPTDTGPSTVYALVNGEKKAYIVADHALYNSMQSLNLPELPFLGFFAGPANLLRNLVTKDPGFMLANMVRDSMSAWVTSGVSMTPVASAVKNFTGALRGTAPEYQALLNAGILGGYEFSQNVEASGKQLSKELAKYGPSTTFGKITKPFTSLWGALEKGTTASDAATRMEVYKNVLAETGNEAEALYRALEVMNFNRKGNSAVIRILTAAVPFLNARIQGLDVLYRAAFGQMATQDAKAIQKSFFIRGATIMAMSMMYWALTHDDDDYMKQEQETRDNYWLIPSLGIKIPIPFEVGVIFKVIPERIAEYAFGNDTGKDFADAMKRNFTNTFAFNPIPQTILPLVEAKADYSFFTGRAILSKGLEGVAPEYQMGPNTSRMAQFFASLTSGMTALPDFLRSPVMIDHIIGGYTGTFGMYAVDAIDAVVSANSDVPKASKRFEQMPVLRRFLLDPEARGNVTAYYDLKNATDEVVRTSNFLERTMNFENYAEYSQDTIKMLASADFVKSLDKDIKELNDVIGVVRNSGMSSDEKRDALLALNQAQNNLTANIKLIKKSLD
jgi:hypothetical protein